METNKDPVISARILNLVATGTPLREAMDTVLGAGTFDRVVSDVWDEAKAADMAARCRESDEWFAKAQALFPRW